MGYWFRLDLGGWVWFGFLRLRQPALFKIFTSAHTGTTTLFKILTHPHQDAQDTSTVFVFEVFGSAAPEVLQLLEGWGRAARSKTPPGEEPPWSARSFIPYWSQLLRTHTSWGCERSKPRNQ